MTDPVRTPAVPPNCRLDADGRIAEDAACVRCGYNLRGLPTAGLCPECGTSVERSLYGGLLAYADPGWVSRLARGVTWTVRGINCILLTLILALVGWVAALNLSSAGGWGFGAANVAAAVLLLAGAVFLLLGYWWLTEPDPGRPDEDDIQKARQRGRIGMFGAILVGVMTPLLTRTLPKPAMVRGVCLLIGSALLVAGCLGFFAYLAKLSQRIPDLELMRKTRSTRTGLVVCLGLYLAASCINIILVRWMTPGMAPGGRVGPAMAVPSCFNGLAFLGLLIYVNRALRLLMQYRKRFRGVLEQAKQNWNAAAASNRNAPA